ncbi:MAG: hypothetical protein HYX48_07130 [Chlamydiales bacterium]|nr:hypothetical protein [Chlamydiales bacterium]
MTQPPRGPQNRHDSNLLSPPPKHIRTNSGQAGRGDGKEGASQLAAAAGFMAALNTPQNARRPSGILPGAPLQALQESPSPSPALERAAQGVGEQAMAEAALGCCSLTWELFSVYWDSARDGVYLFVMQNPLIAVITAIVFLLFGISQILPTFIAALITGIPLISFSVLIIQTIWDNLEEFQIQLAHAVKIQSRDMAEIEHQVKSSELRQYVESPVKLHRQASQIGRAAFMTGAA